MLSEKCQRAVKQQYNNNKFYCIVDSVPREGAMDCHHTVPVLSMLSDSIVRNHVLRLCRSLLLAESHSSF